VFDRVGRVDPVTRGLEIAVNWLGIQFDVCIFPFCCSFCTLICVLVASGVITNKRHCYCTEWVELMIFSGTVDEQIVTDRNIFCLGAQTCIQCFEVAWAEVRS